MGISEVSSNADSTAEGPLLVYGPRSVTYDFGPGHPLSPRRFGPGIDLLRAVGAEPGLAPEPASDEELEWLHSGDYLSAVKRFSDDPDGPPEAGIGSGDDPAFAGMHSAAAAVAGGSIRAMEAILHGDVEHAYHPGGGLHHAMRSRASGFCIYNDVALAIARARLAGLRVMYVDLDVHHGDGVQALHGIDPGVLTISFHESGRSLFPGTGFADEVGEGSAAGTAVNVPFEPMCGPDAWLAAVESLVPVLAAAFGPDVIVSQHGADGHFWDPLAHLSLTTTAMGEAARLVDRVAHRHAGGRWLSTGGGGYAIYRVVPRAWALTWLAAAHRDAPRLLPDTWRERWLGEAVRWGDESLPSGFEDGPEASVGRPVSAVAAASSVRTVGLVRLLTVPALLRVAQQRGWWTADGSAGSPDPIGAAASSAAHSIDGMATASVGVPLTLEMLDRLRLHPRTIAPANPAQGMAILRHALADGGLVTGAVAGEWLVGVALAAPTTFDGVDELAALGVAPEWRRRGLAGAMMAALAEEQDRRDRALVVLHTVAERDPFDPIPREVRRSVAERLCHAAGFHFDTAASAVASADPASFQGVRLPPGAASELALTVEGWSARP